MEYVEGESLAALLGREGRLSPARATEIALSICSGLCAAHSVGVVHRDLKPENVLLDGVGRVVITDFGIACARVDRADAPATSGGVVGTPAYMAPEQVEARPDVDERADIYALGVLLFEMLTGKMPFSGNSPYAVATARLTSDPPDPRRERGDLPEGICRIVQRCMARQRDERYSSAERVSADLSTAAPTQFDELHVSHPSAAWQPPSPAAPTRPGDKTLAVLPFRNSGPPEDDYLADGLTEDTNRYAQRLSGPQAPPPRQRAFVSRIDRRSQGGGPAPRRASGGRRLSSSRRRIAAHIDPLDRRLRWLSALGQALRPARGRRLGRQ